MTDTRVGFTIKQVYHAAWVWYQSRHIDQCCLAENRLMRGERPEGFKE